MSKNFFRKVRYPQISFLFYYFSKGLRLVWCYFCSFYIYDLLKIICVVINCHNFDFLN